MRRLHEPDEAGQPVMLSAAGRSAAEPVHNASARQDAAPALRFDWTDWLPYLEDQDIPDEQKRELIETLWLIVVAFVDLGWRLNPPPGSAGEALDLKAILTAIDAADAEEAE